MKNSSPTQSNLKKVNGDELQKHIEGMNDGVRAILRLVLFAVLLFRVHRNNGNKGLATLQRTLCGEITIRHSTRIYSATVAIVFAGVES